MAVEYLGRVSMSQTPGSAELQSLIADRLREHAGPGREVGWLVDAVIDARPLEMVVLSADIRLSTLLMKEAVDIQLFAQGVSAFMDDCQQATFSHGGFFDKFTGDGFLAYWIPEELNPVTEDADGVEPEWLAYLDSQLRGEAQQTDDAEAFSERYRDVASSYEKNVLEALSVSLSAAAELLVNFSEVTLPMFRSQSRNLSSGVGLSIGIDVGEVQLMPVARQFTILGPPVVGAVRMVSAAQPWETLANVYPGELLNRFPQEVDHDVGVSLEYRKTKEYSRQEVYRIAFNRLSLPGSEAASVEHWTG